MEEMNQNEPKQMNEQRFLDVIHDEYSSGQQYCFILGAGASKTSGIRTGEEMMREWRDYLLKKGIHHIRDSAQDFNLKPEDYMPIFNKDYVLKNDNYFTLFDLRFAGTLNAEYTYLEKEMAGKYPSYGYYPLAMLLSNTRNRLVITTNFDSLIEDALYTYTFQRPLVVGHESLASYIEKDTRHPVIAKIHRDLLLRPLNRKSEMEKLKDEWVKPLRAALLKYIPIVIGYAGGDSTLMSLLNEDKINLDGIYWCCFEEPSDGIKKIVRKHNGYLVKIRGFDEVMFRIGQRFSTEAKFGNPVRYVQEQAEKWCVLYQQNFQAIKSKYQMQKEEQPVPEDTRDDLLRFAISIAQYESRQSAETTGAAAEAKKLADKALDEISYGNLPGAAELYTEAIKRDPDNIDYYRKRSIVLYRLERYNEALLDDMEVLDRDSSNPDHYYSRGVTLHAMGRYDEAFWYKTKAVNLAPSNPVYSRSRDDTLHEIERHKDASRDGTTDIKVYPDKESTATSDGSRITYAAEQYENAPQDEKKAVEQDPAKQIVYAVEQDPAKQIVYAVEQDPAKQVVYTVEQDPVEQIV